MKTKKKVNVKLIVFIIIILILVINKGVVFLSSKLGEMGLYFQGEKQIEFNLEELANNEKFSGRGQEKVDGKDGYDTIFNSINRKYIEYKQVGNASWKDKSYWGGTFEENGCGLAAIATLLSGYEMNYTPEDLRKIYVNFPEEHLEGDQMSEELSSRFGISNTDFLYANVYFKKDYIFEHLLQDKPILICVWNNPDDKWTTASHYMLLLATDGDNKVYVSNPNGLYGKVKMSGWYSTEDILPYIAKAMFIEE